MLKLKFEILARHFWNILKINKSLDELKSRTLHIFSAKYPLFYYLVKSKLRYCQNPNLTTTQRNLNLRLGLTRLLLFIPHHPTPHHPTPHHTTRNSTSTRNKGPSGLKFCMWPHLTKLTTTQHNFNPTGFWGGVIYHPHWVNPTLFFWQKKIQTQIFSTKIFFDQKIF